jgi:PAS domain S-box-containing protein
MKILIADDEALWANLIKGIFEGHNFEVIVTLNGREVVDLAAKEKVDLILLDVNFPDTNGFLICEKASSDPRTESIPVVLLTAQSDPSDLKHGLECGASDYVEKHSSSLELLARVESILKNKNRIKNFYTYEAIVENSPYSIAIIKDAKIGYANKTFLRDFGYENFNELKDIEFINFVIDDDIPVFQSLIDQVNESNNVEFFAFTGKKKNQETVKIEASLKKIQINADIAFAFSCKIVN